MNKLIVFFLVLLLSLSAFGAVQKKRFDVGATEAPAAAATVDTVAVTPPATEERLSLVSAIIQAQKVLREKITAAVTAMKNGDAGALWTFFVICFLYGLLHALGPGHGKSIVVGYFIARRGRWRQGVALRAGITVVHTMSAVVLLFVLYAFFKAAVFPTFEMGRIGVEKASYVLIMVTGLLLVAIAVRDFVKKGKGEHEESGSLPPTARWREVIGVAAITGIVPCPAVALIVLFCLLNSMVFLSLLGALVICLGMTVTNVAFGIAAVAFRKGIDFGGRHSRRAFWIYSTATLAGGLLIFASGLLLFVNGMAVTI